MKILLCSNTMLPDSGGTYTFEIEIIKAISKVADQTDHQFYIPGYKPYQIDNITDIIIENDLVTRAAFFARKKMNALLRIFSSRKYFSIESVIAREAKKNGIDCIYYLSPFVNYHLDLPYVATVHDLQHVKQPVFPEVSLLNVYEDRDQFLYQHLRKASAIIACSDTGKEEIKNMYGIPGSKIVTIHHPTPSYVLNPVFNKDINVFEKYNLQSKYLFYPAQFWAHKNHVCIIDTLAMLNEHGHFFDLVLVGSNKGNIDFVKSYVREKGLEKQVKFPGFVAASELLLLYKNAYALVYPSYFGPENLPPLEAFALGCPVIASKVDGAEEQMENAALFFSVADVNACKDAVLKLLDENIREKQIKLGHEIAQKRAPAEFARDLINLFNSLQNNISTWKNTSHGFQS